MNKIGSSETIRKTTFNFDDYKKNMVSHKKTINKHFLEWFVGFSEGDGSFIVSNNRLFFIINQKEEKILHIIRSYLGFGKVSTYYTYSRFIVADITSIDRLICIFNGNLLLNKTSNRFKLWLNARNGYSASCIQYLGKNSMQILGKCNLHDNSWLTGFIDAEGCFNSFKNPQRSTVAGCFAQPEQLPATQTQNGKCKIPFTVNLRFIIDQNEKFILEKIKCFLKSGCIQKTLAYEHMYKLAVSHRKSHEILIQYLKKHPLRSIKKVSFLRFCSIYRYIQEPKQQKNPTRKSLKKLERLLTKI